MLREATARPRTSVALKTLRDQRRALLWWTVSIVVLVGMYVGIYPSIGDNPSYSQLIDQMPESLRALFTAGGGDITSPEGYLYVELMSFVGPLVAIGYAVAAGASAVAGEEDKHTLDLLLVNPVTRGRVVVEKALAMLAGLVLLMGVMWAALLLMGSAADMGLSPHRIGAVMVHMGLLGLEFGALALLIGAATGRLALARAVPAAVAVVAYLVNGLAPLVDWLEPFRALSPFYQYIAHDPIRTGFDVGSIAVTVVSIVVLVALAVVLFGRRDVEA